MSIPPGTSPELAQTLRQMQAQIDRLQASAATSLLDLHGRRLINAGDAVDPGDYVTRRQLTQALAAGSPGTGTDLTVRNLDVKQRARVFGDLMMPNLDGAAVVFTRDGHLDADEAHLSWRFSNLSLLLGQTVKLRWRHGIWLEQVTDPGVSVVFVISGEDSNTTTPLARVALGQDTASYPALVPNGANLEVRKAGAAGALTELSAKKFHPDTPATYTATNVTTDRSFDADSTTLDEVADVLGSLIADLRTAGLVL